MMPHVFSDVSTIDFFSFYKKYFSKIKIIVLNYRGGMRVTDREVIRPGILMPLSKRGQNSYSAF